MASEYIIETRCESITASLNLLVRAVYYMINTIIHSNVVTIGKNIRTYVEFDGESSRSSEDECGNIELHDDV
jgi:hypothetical protein